MVLYQFLPVIDIKTESGTRHWHQLISTKSSADGTNWCLPHHTQEYSYAINKCSMHYSRPFPMKPIKANLNLSFSLSLSHTHTHTHIYTHIFISLKAKHWQRPSFSFGILTSHNSTMITSLHMTQRFTCCLLAWLYNHQRLHSNPIWKPTVRSTTPWPSPSASLTFEL